MKKIVLLLLIIVSHNVSSQCSFKEVTTVNATSFGIGLDNKLYGWGFSSYYNLGGVSGLQANVTQIGTSTNWSKIDGGNIHVLLLKSDGTLWAMGRNVTGQLGDNTTTDRPNPIQIGTDNDWTAISAGQNYSLALKSNGTLWAWGYNLDGLLGVGANVNQLVPIQIGNQSDWAQISASKGSFNFAIKNDGTLWGWGRNDGGKLGLGNSTNTTIPLQVGNANNWLEISSGINHTIALKNDHTLWAWGSNNYGELGNNTLISSSIPIQIGNQNDWQSVNANYISSKAIKTNGTLWSWGYNGDGELGDGTIVNKLIPTQTGTDTDWTTIYSGQAHVLAVKSNSKIYSWGTNNYGQLGNGNTTNLSSPYEIVCTTLNNTSFDLEDSSIQIYPNPANEQLFIQLANNFDEFTNTEAQLYNVQGQLLRSIVLKSAETTIQVDDLITGIYFVTIKTPKGTFTKKIIKI